MKFSMRLGALLATLLPLTVIGGPSHAAGTLTATTSSLTISSSTSCATFPITWFVTVPDGADNWSISGDIINSAGASVASIFYYEQAAVTQASDSYTLCVPAGTTSYTVSADVESYDNDYPFPGDATIHFSQPLNVTYTPPPPPPPATFKSSVHVKDIVKYRAAHGVKVGFLARLKNSCGCNVTRSLQVQARKHGTWHTLHAYARVTNGFKTVSLTVPYGYDKVRARTPATIIGGDTFRAATSLPFSIPTHP
jgi:hypothetical protein